MRDMLIDIQYDPEQNNYIYSFRMSEQKKHDLEKRLQSYGVTLEEAIPNYLQAVMNREDKKYKSLNIKMSPHGTHRKREVWGVLSPLLYM